ncbi:hypothetical protein [Cupriavidus sp. amp6]|uniref:hypothetical protein n=1 Tax=Cupriavidus sp. amp6 TaxID=388051 RepID=UPI0004100A2B|nr:hypothetical protein [Cupriavidus sp. amp6]
MYNALVEAFRSAQGTSLDAYDRVCALAAQVRADATIVPVPIDQAGDFRRFLRRLVASLIDRASKEFGIEGAPVCIDETRIPVNGHPNIWEAIRAGDTPDLDRYWRVLAERYQASGRASVTARCSRRACRRARGLASAGRVCAGCGRARPGRMPAPVRPW